jgi:excisionase family DNA binding protein
MSDRVMTLQQAAEFLQIDVDTLRVLVRQGKVPGAKVGRQWRLEEGLLREWLRERSLEPKSAAANLETRTRRGGEAR